MAERRKRLQQEESANFLSILSAYPIEIDPVIDREHTLFLARRHGLSIYDSAYLELAARRKIALATLDSALEAAARAEGIALLS